MTFNGPSDRGEKRATVGSWRLFVATVVITLVATFPVGSCSIYNSIQVWVKPFIQQSFYDHYGILLNKSLLTLAISLWTSTVYLGVAFGSSMVGRFAEKFGRRDAAMVVASSISILASIVQSVAKPLNSFEMLFVGVFGTGSAAGMVSSIVPFALAECAPNRSRGFIGTLSATILFGNKFICMGLAQPAVLGGEALWPLLVAFPIIPAVLSMVIRSFFPESPKFLYITKGRKADALASLEFYHGITDAEEIEQTLLEFRREHELANSRHNSTWREILVENPLMRRGLFVVVMVVAGHEVVGSTFVQMYSTPIFESAGFSLEVAAQWSLACFAIGTLCSVVSLFIVETVGRRKLLLFGFFIGVVANIILSASGMEASLSVLGVVLIIVAFNSSIALISHFIVSEVCPQASRSKTSGFAWTFTRSLSTIVVFFFPLLGMTIGEYTYVIFAIASFIWLIWLFVYLPETKQRAVHSIVAESVQSPDDDAAPLIPNDTSVFSSEFE